MSVRQEATEPPIPENVLRQRYYAPVELLIHLTTYNLCCDGLQENSTVQCLCEDDPLFQHMPFDNKQADSTEPASHVSQTSAAAEHVREDISHQPQSHAIPQPIQAWPNPSPKQWVEIQSIVNRASILFFRLIPAQEARSHLNSQRPTAHENLMMRIVKLLALLLAGTGLQFTVASALRLTSQACCRYIYT